MGRTASPRRITGGTGAAVWAMAVGRARAAAQSAAQKRKRRVMGSSMPARPSHNRASPCSPGAMAVLELLLLLLLSAVALGWVARHFKFPYPIALVAGGAVL